MTKLVFQWNARKNFNVMKDIINKASGESFNVLADWFGRYDELLKTGGDIESANEWVKETFNHSIEHLESLLQAIANETQDNTLVQKRLEAIGFRPDTKLNITNDEKIAVIPISSNETIKNS